MQQDLSLDTPRIDENARAALKTGASGDDRFTCSLAVDVFTQPRSDSIVGNRKGASASGPKAAVQRTSGLCRLCCKTRFGARQRPLVPKSADFSLNRNNDLAKCESRLFRQKSTQKGRLPAFCNTICQEQTFAISKERPRKKPQSH